LKGTTTHFRQEEEVLLPVLARYGEDLLGQEPVVEMLLQHARIRGLVMGLSDEVKVGGVRPETLGRIGELLETHIRLEEREVFPMIEKVLPEEGLKEVASRLKVKEAGPRTEPWVPKEGLSYEPWPGPGDSEGGGYDWPPTPR
jgi:hemerythrin-like domain-containing protein